MKYLMMALFFTFTAVAHAADFAADGPGAQTCTRFLALWALSPDATPADHQSNSVETIAFAWAQGFMSGLNASRSDGMYAVLNAETVRDQEITLWNYCNAHPDDYYMKAVADLYKALPVKSLKSGKP
jgi:hypothetical protein